MEEEKKEEFEEDSQKTHDDQTKREKSVSEAQQIAWLSYLGILVIVPILVNPDNEFIKFHARQGIALLLFEIGWIFIEFFLRLMPIIRYLAGVISFFVWVGFIALSVIGIVNAIQGEWKKLPIIGEFGDSIKVI